MDSFSADVGSVVLVGRAVRSVAGLRMRGVPTARNRTPRTSRMEARSLRPI